MPAAPARRITSATSTRRVWTQSGGQVQAGHRRDRHHATGPDARPAPASTRRWRASYSRVARRMCRPSRPSSMNRARAASGRGVTVPVAELLRRARNAARSEAGAIRKPRREHGQHRFGEGPDVQHAAVAVQALQRIQWPAGEPELAVVVVLDDHRVPASGPVQDRRPPGQRHRRAERELVRRRGVDQPGRGRDGGHVDALSIHRYADHPGAQRSEQRPRRCGIRAPRPPPRCPVRSAPGR